LKAKAVIRLRFDSEKRLNSIVDALTPEISKPGVGRAKVVLEREGTFLLLKVEANDTVALRSTLNAYLRWFASTSKVVEILENPS
jgi:tRNA threonylcarbamoyladenosine modification (KEOPS) complex  Pcc1 subunit